MSDSYLGFQNPTTVDKKLDTEQLAVGINVVERERVQIAGKQANQIAPVDAVAGLKVDLGSDNDVVVSGSVTANLGTLNGAATAAKQDTIIAHVDGIESTLSTIDSNTSTVASNTTTANTHLSEIEGAVETVESTVATINTTPLVRTAIFDDSNTQITSFGGSQYTEGDADTSFTGNMLMWETQSTNTANTVREDKPLPVAIYDNGSQANIVQGHTDSVDNQNNGVNTASFTYAYNGSSWSRMRGDSTYGLDVDVTRLPAIPAGTNLIGRVSSSSETSTIYDGTTALTPKFAVINASTSGNNTIVAAVTGKKIRVHQLLLVASGTVTVRFESGADGTALTGLMNLIASTGFTLPYSPVGWFETASNTLLNLELSGAVSVGGVLTYTEV